MENKLIEDDAWNMLATGKLADETSKVPALYSIAISLKRIADIMQGKQQPVIMTAEQYKAYKKGN